MSLYVDIEKKLGQFHLKVNFEADKETLAILGASGCGKSMTLKCIAGIEKPDKGKIVLDGKVLFDSSNKINLPPQQRKVGYLFQQYALFPNMTVEQNIGCAIKDKKNKDSIIQQYIDTMNLNGLEKKKPHQLSGGQQQRVALARILANEPEVLLLDEPFSALDSHLRSQLEREVHEIIKEFNKTVIFVSHDRDEAFRMSDNIAIMNDGMIETIGFKKDVFDNPRTKSGAILTGCNNFSSIQVLDENYIYANEWNLKLYIPHVRSNIKYIGFRMNNILINEKGDENNFECRIIEEIENPFSYTIVLTPVNTMTKLSIQVDKKRWNEIRKEKIFVTIPSESILLLEE